MTDEQKSKIKEYRYLGASYKAIALAVGVKQSTVKTYCSRNGLTDKDITLQKKLTGAYCPYCGVEIKKITIRKPRRFCSDKCRYNWWNKHRELKPKTNGNSIKCKFCGKEFTYYGKDKRKYCCHECYVSDRYGNDRSVIT